MGWNYYWNRPTYSGGEYCIDNKSDGINTSVFRDAAKRADERRSARRKRLPEVREAWSDSRSDENVVTAALRQMIIRDIKGNEQRAFSERLTVKKIAEKHGVSQFAVLRIMNAMDEPVRGRAVREIGVNRASVERFLADYERTKRKVSNVETMERYGFTSIVAMATAAAAFRKKIREGEI